MARPRRADFVERTEDLSGSPLWNPSRADAARAPHWSTYHIAAIWIGMSVAITTYTLASGLMQQGHELGAGDGNHHPPRHTIVLVPMILNATPARSTRLVSRCLPRQLRVKGANIPAMLRALVACGWFGIQPGSVWL